MFEMGFCVGSMIMIVAMVFIPWKTCGRRNIKVAENNAICPVCYSKKVRLAVTSYCHGKCRSEIDVTEDYIISRKQH